MTFLRFDGSADFTVEETATGRMVDFRLTNEETLGREGERSRVFTWRSKGLVDNFEIRVGSCSSSFACLMALSRTESSQENPLFA